MSRLEPALRRYVEAEQVALWDDLSEAIDRAFNRAWSMDASNHARRVVAAARLVGPTDPDELAWDLVAGGVYALLLQAGGVQPPTITEDTWQHWAELHAKQGERTREQHWQRYAATRAAIDTPSERAAIAEEIE